VVSDNKAEGEAREGFPLQEGEGGQGSLNTLNFSDRTGTGALVLVWWYPTIRVKEKQGEDSRFSRGVA
jgi:hypothetical protein